MLMPLLMALMSLFQSPILEEIISEIIHGMDGQLLELIPFSVLIPLSGKIPAALTGFINMTLTGNLFPQGLYKKVHPISTT